MRKENPVRLTAEERHDLIIKAHEEAGLIKRPDTTEFAKLAEANKHNANNPS